MTRQNRIPVDEEEAMCLIPLYDMFNHEHGQVSASSLTRYVDEHVLQS